MGIIFRRRIRLGRRGHLNLSKSGVSASTRFGRLTLNSRGRSSIRVFKGLSIRF